MHFWGLDLAGKQFGGDFEQLTKIARLGSCVKCSTVVPGGRGNWGEALLIVVVSMAPQVPLVIQWLWMGWIGVIWGISWGCPANPRFRFIVGDDPLDFIGKYEGDI